MTNKRQGIGGNFNQAERALADAFLEEDFDLDKLIGRGVAFDRQLPYARERTKEYLKETKKKNLSKDELIEQFGNDFEKGKNYTIHEVNNPKVQIVPYAINHGFDHNGGVSEMGGVRKNQDNSDKDGILKTTCADKPRQIK